MGGSPNHPHPQKSLKKQTDVPLGTEDDLKAMQRGRRTRLSRGDSAMDGPYERRNETIKHLRGVLKRSPFVRARWG